MFDVDGFLPGRASLVLDFIVVALVPIVALAFYSVHVVRTRQAYALHKKLQVTVSVVLFAAIVVFEGEMRFYGWEHRAEASSFWRTEGLNPVWTMLLVHLAFSISTTLIWIVVFVRALRNFRGDPTPNEHSAVHRRWARIAMIDFVLTVVTGWIFWWMAFVA